MLTHNELTKLAALLNHLHQCMDLKFGLMDEKANEIYSADAQTEFCKIIKRDPEGLQRCLDCDRAALHALKATQKLMKYRCHCGLLEIAMPVVENGSVIATILFGQFLDDSAREEQWRATAKCIGWHSSAGELHHAFLCLKQISNRQLFSLTEIVHACIAEVRLQGLVNAANQSDILRFQSYIQQNFAQPLPLQRICEAMNIGKSKLFEMCRRELNCTPGQLILKTRMEAARELLAATDYDIPTIAEIVGIPDANYFAKRFKCFSGQTPSAFRRKLHNPARFEQGAG